MAEKAGDGREIDLRLVRLASDSLRIEMLRLLNERMADAGEVANELNVSVATVSVQLEEMCEIGLIEIVTGQPGGAGAEPHYRALVRAMWDNEEWSQLSGEEQRRLSAWIVQLIGSDTAESLQADTFSRRQNTHASRTVLAVDEQGWDAVAQIQDKALEAILAVQAASAERLVERGEEGIPAIAAMLCFEMPSRPGPS